MAYTQKQFLDYAGLAKFWELIKGKFVASVAVGENGAVFSAANGEELGTIGIATTTSAGLMSSAQVEALNNISGDIQDAIKLEGVKVKGTAAGLDGKAVNLDFVYNSDAKEIQVIDLNANSAVLTKIDATAFIKDGMLDSADIVTKDGKAYIRLVWNTDAGKETTDIDVSDVIMPYSAGNGLELTDVTDGKMFSVKVSADEKYITADSTGLHTTTQLVTDYTKAATDAAASALTDAKAYTDEQITLVNTEVAKKADAQATTEALALKANAADVYTKTQVDETLKSYYTSAQVDETLKSYDTAEVAQGKIDVALAAAKKYTDDEIAELSYDTAGSAAAALAEAKEYADSLVTDEEGKSRFDAAGSAAAAQEAAQGYADRKIAELVGEGGALAGTLQAAKDYADGLNTAMDARVDVLEADRHAHTNKEVLDGITAEKVTAWDSAEANANGYTDTKIGTLPEGSTTVVAAIEAAQEAAQGYADAQAKAVYDAMVRITEDEITAIVNGTIQA